jgi:histidinol-phosphatase (PHP family)
MVKDSSPLPADNHVHTEWSWDAASGDMDATCRQAVALGLRSVAFTEHADFVHGARAVFDPVAYLEAVERCRSRYPDLRILSGVELGEPHRFPDEVARILAAGFDRVLASIHGVDWDGRFTDASQRGFLTEHTADAFFRRYLDETAALLASDADFEVLAHLDYPKRYWPAAPAFNAAIYEEEFRAILRSAAKRGTVLEINTTRGGEPSRFLCPAPPILDWWREEGGRALSFGSDAHRPGDLGKGLDVARAAAEAAGFTRGGDPNGFWLR